ncbi:hypothetical protein AVEN_60513-1 [Araneus ventricosus]|uniref:Tc1-like transposase DDE domain-containing protein n=1 Tax=Araneus ventricosus TaxID=182803 RepID=A0A4Y2FTK4_ARAVE|nr:hypothetical protein AVEN_60513-1 [Araneus ventricosus]
MGKRPPVGVDRKFGEVTETGFKTCSVIGKRYQDILKTFVTLELQQRNRLQDTIFMQNGAPPHIHRSVKQVSPQTFTNERVISRGFPTAWPPRWPDLTPCDFWLWGFVKDQVYREHCHILKMALFVQAQDLSFAIGGKPDSSKHSPPGARYILCRRANVLPLVWCGSLESGCRIRCHMAIVENGKVRSKKAVVSPKWDENKLNQKSRGTS